MIDQALHILDWAIISLSFFNTIAFLWLGLAVLLNAERRRWGTWAAGGGLLLGGLYFAGHSSVVGRDLGTFGPDTEFWWRISWLPVVGAPYMWYLVTAWYTGVLRTGRHRLWLPIVSVLGLGALLVLAVADPLPSYVEVVQRSPLTVFTIWGVPVVILIYPVYSALCIILSLFALRRPEASERFMGDLARQRARPWLIAASIVLLMVILLLGAAAVVFLSRLQTRLLGNSPYRMLGTMMGFDLLISGLVAVAIVLIGRAIVSYEIFTGKTLPRGGLFRYWRRSLMLAAGYGALVGLSLSYPGSSLMDPTGIYRLLLATILMTLFYALLSWRSYVDRERSMDHLRPFVASQRLYEHLLMPAAPPDVDIAAPFRALCEDVLGARLAYLAALGPLAPLAGPWLCHPPDTTRQPAQASPPDLTDLTGRFRSPQTICVPIEAQRYGGAVWAVPLWSERGLIGVLLLGDKRDGGLYTQEEIEIARATGERLIDTQASAEMARRLMGLQRQRLAESQVLDRRARRILHDDVLPRLHTAMLMLSADHRPPTTDHRPARTEDGGWKIEDGHPDASDKQSSFLHPPSLIENSHAPAQSLISNLQSPTHAEAVALLGEVHREIANLLHEMPATASPEVARLGLIGALRRALEDELGSAFDGVRWQIEPEAERAARELPALNAEVVFYAAREAIRNAARYGRNGDTARPLHLHVYVAWRGGLELVIEDDGVGIGAASPVAAAAGRGLGLHGTMMAVVGGTLTTESAPGAYTRISLALPQGTW